jgi:hypothetical protein
MSGKALLAAAICLSSAGLLAACSLLSPLDYLQSGGPPIADGGSSGAEAGGVLPEAGLTPDTFAGAQDFPSVVALDGASVYWHAAGATASIMAAPKTGGTPRVVAAAPPPVAQIAADADPGGDVYWASGTQISRAPKAGGAPAVVYTASAAIQGFAVDETSLYVAEADDDEGVYAIARAPKAGGPRVVLDDVDSATAIAVDATDLLWADSIEGVVRSLPKGAAPDGGAPAVLGDADQDTIDVLDQGAFALRADAFFWTDGELIGRHLRAPGVVGQTLYTDPDDTSDVYPVGDLAVDDAFVWFVGATSSELRRVPIKGGDAETVVRNQPTIRGLATDGANVWFTVQGADPKTGAVLEIPAK